ncbi:hypothetical protein ACFXJ8_41470 [Nonomuraea sp. NPDC059194]|uniref:hypothetical protein n=1 Tax=Nonomuraea sp. NPDC059194 TaxID=3346764 RepID=UPI00367F94BC
MDSDIALAFLQRFPTPQSAAKLNTTTMTAFLHRSGYSGGKSGGELVERLRQAPEAAGRIGRQTVTVLITTQAEQVRALVDGIADLESAIKKALEDHPCAFLFRRISGVLQSDCVHAVGASPLSLT